MLEVIEYLNEILNENSSCVLALSGGPDSMCLLNLLLKIKEKKKINIICVHINHNTRKNCLKDYEFVKDYVENKNIILEYYKIDNYEKGRFTEEEGRKKRYAFFKKTVKKYHADYLFTAHHIDDLTETIIMRMLRGSTLNGYAGFKKESTWDDIKIIRPLFSKKKSEILNYLHQNNVPYIIDETNEKDEYLRNRIRHSILKCFEEIAPDYPKKILKFSATLNESNEIIENNIKELEKTMEENGKIKKSEFLKLSNTLKKVYLRKYLKEVYQESLHKITEKHIEIALKMIENGHENQKINFPDKKILYKNNEYIWIENYYEKESFCIKCERVTNLPNGDTLVKLENYTEKSNYEIHLNSKEITLPLYLVTRKNGMKMAVKNLNGSKKVNDILIDCKIKDKIKDQIPILIDSKEQVLWVLGLKKSKYDLEKNESYDIIYKYIKKEGKKL